MALEVVIGGILLIALTTYGLSGGADFGAGVWDLLASGPRAQAQREQIAKAIAPIWEANNVWLVLLVVVLFTGFPAAFAAILTALNIPLSIMLVGIVLRGAAFAFRSHGAEHSLGSRYWGRLFAIGSIITPVMLGVCLGTLSSGSIRVENGVVTRGFFSSWLTPFSWAVCALALALIAYLAALYLPAESVAKAPIRARFRVRAAPAAIAAAILAPLVYSLPHAGFPSVRRFFCCGGERVPSAAPGLDRFRESLYRAVLILAAIYNLAFGDWAGFWPRAFFDVFGLAAAQCPAIWRCLGMVV